MSTGSQTRTRSQRVASVAQQQSWWSQLLSHLRQGGVLLRLCLCAVAAILLWLIMRGWAPPRMFYEGQIPSRDILARTTFDQVDPDKTEEAKERERNLALAIFRHDPTILEQLFAQLQNDIQAVFGEERLEDVDVAVWKPFEALPVNESTPTPQMQFAEIKDQFAAEKASERFQAALDAALKQLQQDGLLDTLPANWRHNFQRITVRLPLPDEGDHNVAVEQVLIEQAARRLEDKLRTEMPSQELAAVTFRWLSAKKLPVTLTLDPDATLARQDEEEEKVEPVLRTFSPVPSADNVLALAGEPLNEAAVARLELEYQALEDERTWVDRLGRSLAFFGMVAALYILCGVYIALHDRSIVSSLSKFVMLLALFVLTVGLSVLLAETLRGWQAELVPMLLFGMIAAILYQQEIALLLVAVVVLVVIIGLGQPLANAVILWAASSSAVLMLGRIRSRSKLLVVGFVAAIVAFCAAIGVGTLDGLPLFPTLFVAGGRLALWAVIAGSLMTCLLPLVESVFEVQTDISLVELSDPAHPLLQELIRRAPGTYNHSITVASLAESACDAIGARSLLVRVGAYFHDIGKMLKPGYFIENQSQGDNRHESLVPAMSTLVIIAHVKDGADLARQHRLPDSIIDFIQQHHGTTLVEFFYRRASQQQSEEGGDEVDETTFRYPGPKPQSKEAAVLMLADAVESASRVLSEPGPARIESLVRDITMKRLLDGQFNECNLTLEEVRAVEDSLIKSLTAVYHGRVKYPDQETA